MRRGWMWLIVVGSLWAPRGAGAWCTPSQLVEALGIPSSDVVNVSIVNGSQEMLNGVDSVGVLSASDPPMGVMFTGMVDQMTSCVDSDMPPTGQNGDTITIRVDLIPPAGMHSFKFNFYFLSREYPAYVGSMYNDAFTVDQNSSIYSGNIVFDASGNVIDVNSALFTVTNQALLVGTGFDCSHGGGGSGWLTTVSPCVPEEQFSLTFSIGDLSDGVYDSGVLLDGFAWREQEEEEPHPAEPIGLKFLSPKVGPTAGGQTTVIYGSDFESDCSVSFGGDAVDPSSITVLSSERIEVVTPPHATEEMVDVRVWSSESDSSLENGYTYSDEDPGSFPPELAEVDPPVGPLEGDIPVAVRGGHFSESTTITFDGAEADCSLNGQATEFACTLPPYGGDETQAVVLVEAVNTSGLEAMPPLTFTYSEDAAAGGGGGAQGCECHAAPSRRAAAPAVALAGLALLALTLRRRREV